MSAPVQDNIDRRSMYAPPWARNEQNEDDTRRIPAEIAAAAELKEGQQKPSRAVPQQTHRARHDEARTGSAKTYHEETAYHEEMALQEEKADPEDEQFDLEDAIRGQWASSRLEPVRMPPPPKADGPTWGMLSRLTGAVGFAVIVALFVTGAIPMPSINITLPRDDRGGRMVEPAVAKPEAGKQMASSPGNYAAQPTFVPRPAAPLPSTVGVAMSAPPPAPAPAPTITASVQPAPWIEPPRPPQTALPQARVPNFMNLAEIESLLTRGHELLASGDIAGGRLLLTRAAEAGDPRASLALAGTYDAPVMPYLGVIDVPPDPVKARAWYMKAAAQGSPEASRRLERLAGR